MANFEQWINQDLQDPVQAIYSQSLAFSSDNDSILVGVHVTDGGEPAMLSGSVVAHVIRSADGGTVSFSGTLSGSDVSAVLPAACFAYPGQIAVMLQLVSGTTKTTLCKALYSVVQGETGTPIDPGSVVPDLADLLAMLDEMAQATTAANAAAAAVPAIIAPTFSASAAYVAGSYVYYNGALYRFTADHAAGAWVGTDAVSVQLASEVADLKSAISAVADIPINLYNDETYVEGYYIDTATGNVTQYNNWGYFTASVKGEEKYYLMGVPTSDPTQYITVGDLYIGYYDGDNFVSGQRIVSTAGNKALSVPVNANIAKVSTHNYSLGHGNSSSLKNEKIMFVSANVYPEITVPGDYVPYTVDRIQIKETALPDSVLFDSDLDSYDLVPAIEPYFKDEVTETVNTTLAKSNKPCTILSVVTDSHVNFSNQTRLEQAEDTFNNLRTVNQKVWCDCIAHLGDLLVADDSTITQEMADQYMNYIRTRLSSAKDKLFITQGNHDGLGGSAPHTQNYNSLGKFNSAYVVRDGDNPYFYVDFDNPKVRLVFLALPQRVKIGTTEYNYWGLYTPQLRWLGQVALNVDDGRNVIICSHIGSQSSDFRKNRAQTVGILNAFNAHSTFDVYYEETTNFIYTADFTNLTNSKVVLWICGHEHFDWLVPESVSGLTFPLVALTCSYCHNETVPSSAASQGAVAPTRTAGTVTQEAWTIIIYNAEDAKISFVRFGAGTDFEINLSDYTSFS